MRAIDKIQPPCTFYYEDVDGNNIPFDYQKGMPDHNKPWHAQHSKGVLVQHSIVFGTDKDDRWPVKALKWLLKKMPSGWKKSWSMTFNSTINSAYPMIKYLVEQRNFRFNEACVAVSEMCGRCSDICEAELNNSPVVLSYRVPNMYCKFCDIIDPEYVIRRRIWACYRTMMLGGNISKAYKESSPNSGKYYFSKDMGPKKLKSLWHYIVGHPGKEIGWGYKYITCLSCDKRWEESKRPRVLYNIKNGSVLYHRYIEWLPKTNE